MKKPSANVTRNTIVAALQFAIVSPTLLLYSPVYADCTAATLPPTSGSQDAGDAQPSPAPATAPSDDINPNGTGKGPTDADHPAVVGDAQDTGSSPSAPSGSADFGLTDNMPDDSGNFAGFGDAEGWSDASDFGGFGGGGGADPKPTNGRPFFPEPVDSARISKFENAVDYASTGAAPLHVGRVYDSNPTARAAAVTVNIGTGWHSYYDRSIQAFSGTQVRLHRANGRIVDFNLNGSTWTATVPSGALSQISGGWQYVNDRNNIETYDTTGKLLSMATGGLVNSMQYDASRRLVKVVNPFGRSVAYGYDASNRVSTVTLPDNSTLGYGYDSNNNLSTVRFADNSTRQYLYENSSFPNAMTGILDESGRRISSWTYDAQGRPASGHNGTATAAYTVSYNGNQVTTTDARNTQRTRTYTAFGAGRPLLTSLQTAATADSAATAWSFTYDSNGNPLKDTTRTGEVRQYSADARGRVTALTRAASTSIALSSQTTWHPTFRLPTSITNRGVTTNFGIDGYGRLTQVTRTSGNTQVTIGSVTYNTQNLIQSATDARGATHSYTYDSSGNVSTYTDELGKVSTFQNYNAHGQAGTITLANGTVISRTFDSRFRVLTRTVAGATTQYAYDGAGRIIKITAPDSSWRSYTYDAGGYLTGAANDRGETTVVTRDATGAATQAKTYTSGNALAQQSTRQINAVGNTSALVDSRNYATSLLYATDGRPSGTRDPLNLTRTVQLDTLNRTTGTTLPNTTAMRNAGGAATVSTTQGYDANANHNATTDTGVVATGYAHDGFNRTNGESGNDAGGVGYVSDPASGDLQTRTDPLSNTITWKRDNLGRVASVSSAETGVRSFGYVPGRTDSLPASLTDNSGSSAWTYDSLGRMLTQQQTVNGVQHNLTVHRDSLGRPSSITYPSGMVLGINYSADVVSSLTVNSTTLLSNVTYLPFTQTATGWHWGNGSTYSRSFDADGRITSVTLGSKVRGYGYDAAGRITSQGDTTGSTTATTTYGYDEAGHLISYAPPSGSGQTYTYDANGNRQTEVFNGVSGSYAYTASSNKLTTVGNVRAYKYLGNGNPTTIGNGYNLTYDDEGEITLAAGTAYPYRYQVAYIRNGLGQLAGTQVNYLTCNTTGGGGNPALKSNRITASSSTAPASTTTCSSQTVQTTTYTYDDQGHLLGEYNTSGSSSHPLSQTSCRFPDLHGSTTTHEPKPTLQRIPRPSAEQGQTARHA